MRNLRRERLAANLAAVYSTAGARRFGAVIPYRARRQLAGLGCCSSCSRSTLQGLGVITAAGTTETGQLVSAGASIAAGAATSAAIGTAAGTAGAAVLGAAAGSVVPVVGTIVGAAIGFLTSKLFGSADYTQIYATLENRIQLAQAYIQVAGQYPGRVYGWQEIFYIWNGLVAYGMFPQNYNLDGSLGKNPPLGSCKDTGSMGYACGEESWTADWVQGAGGGGIPKFIEEANKAGITNPEQIYSQYLVPAMSTAPCSGCVLWYAPNNARAGYASLVEQLEIDTVDAYEYNQNANLPCYYGSIPSGSAATCGPSTTAAPAATTATAQSITPSTPVQATTQQATTATPATPVLPAGFTAITQDVSGNPVYENADGVLYEWDAASGQMNLFDGELYVDSGTELSTLLQAGIQSNLADGETLETATQNALAAIQATGTNITPEIQAGTEQAVETTYAAPATVAAPAASSSFSVTDWLLLGAAVLGLGALWAVFDG